MVESRFHVDLKSNCALINTSMEFLLGPIIRRINLLYKSRMKWTWHHSKLAVEEVSFFGGLRVVLLQLLSIDDGAVGVTNLGIMLLWSAPSHYLNQCWNTVNWTLGNKLQWNLNQNLNIFIQWKMHLKMLSAKWQQFCPGLNVLTHLSLMMIYGVGNGLVLFQHQAIMQTNADLLSIGPLQWN